MFTEITDVITDALLDTAKLLPFLLLTYLAMEYLEHRAEKKTASLVGGAGKLGPVIGAVCGVLPQCGFSASAASLFSGGVITAGTLLAVFLSTSDEMLPIFISEAVAVSTILKILLTKVVIGMAAGFLADFLCGRHLQTVGEEKDIHDLCEKEHCHCEDGIVKSALRHTLRIAVFIFLISVVIGFLIAFAGEDALAALLSGKPVLGVFLSGIVGLIPNCAASVVITELYLQGLLSAGQMMSGLLVGAGVGLLVLFRTNRNQRENLKILGMLYAAGVIGGLLIEISGVVF